jgi:hypothetical protein
MILTISVAVTLSMGIFSYFVLFRGFSDFIQGLRDFFRMDEPLSSNDSVPPIRGFRVFLLVLTSLAAGCLTYWKLAIGWH